MVIQRLFIDTVVQLLAFPLLIKCTFFNKEHHIPGEYIHSYVQCFDICSQNRVYQSYRLIVYVM